MELKYIEWDTREDQYIGYASNKYLKYMIGPWKTAPHTKIQLLNLAQHETIYERLAS